MPRGINGGEGNLFPCSFLGPGLQYGVPTFAIVFRHFCIYDDAKMGELRNFGVLWR